MDGLVRKGDVGREVAWRDANRVEKVIYLKERQILQSSPAQMMMEGQLRLGAQRLENDSWRGSDECVQEDVAGCFRKEMSRNQRIRHTPSASR
jgi:hypothetical protein